MLFFAAFGARIVLQASPTRHDAGAVNRLLLDALDVASFGAVAVLSLLLLVWNRFEPWRAGRRAFAAGLLVLAAGAAFASHRVITPEMMALRERMGVIDLVPKTDPLRRTWGQLHGLSSLSLVLRIGASAGLFLLALSANESRVTGR